MLFINNTKETSRIISLLVQSASVKFAVRIVVIKNKRKYSLLFKRQSFASQGVRATVEKFGLVLFALSGIGVHRPPHTTRVSILLFCPIVISNSVR